MNFNRIVFSVTLLMTFMSSACYSKKQPAPLADKGFAVVELFTSEGCSSCPAAESVLSGIHDEYKQNVYVMEFHVDYWNYIGWKDVFGSNEYTKRQQQYARVFQLNSTYTPQAIVNGKNELVGSDKSKLHELINDNLQKTPSNTISLSASVNGNSASVKFSVADIHAQILNIALVQKKAETNVRKGENSGRKLKHINVVRAFETVDAQSSGSLNIPLPQGLSARDCMLIAYTQNKNSWAITGASEVEVK